MGPPPPGGNSVASVSPRAVSQGGACAQLVFTEASWLLVQVVGGVVDPGLLQVSCYQSLWGGGWRARWLCASELDAAPHSNPRGRRRRVRHDGNSGWWERLVCTDAAPGHSKKKM